MGDLVYHYTTPEGLMGILSSQSFWLSDYRSLNDRSEVAYAFGVIREVIEAKCGLPAFASLRDFDWEKMIADGSSDPVLIGSFSASPDNPISWRLYSGEKGYEIGIERAALQESARRMQNATCGFVLYMRDEQLKFVSEKLARFAGWKNVQRGGLERDLQSELRRISFFFFLHEVAPFIKSEFFEHEREWRISSHIREFAGLKFRCRNGDIIPYAELRMDACDASKDSESSWLRSIVMGPRVEVGRTMPQIYSLLKSSRVDPRTVDFYHSKIPI